MKKDRLISVVMPVFNEGKGLKIFYDRLEDVIDRLDYDVELIFVNDGSTDNSLDVLISLRENDRRIKIVDLSRNFGHQNALVSGMDQAYGDAVVLMDVDMEDRPEYIPAFIDQWEKGYQVVYARRGKRNASVLKKFCFNAFHKINRFLSSVNIDAAGIFCLMDRSIVGHMRDLTERDKYIPGLRSWIGFRQTGVDTIREGRYDNKSRVKLGRLFKLAFDSFTSFSSIPLKISMFFGIIFSALSFAGIAMVIALKFIFKVAILGWASTICVVLLLGGIQLICIGLQGEYIARIFNEVKRRPSYIIRNRIGFGE